MLQPYSDAYIESVFQAWYKAGRPTWSKLQGIIDTDEYNRLPHVEYLARWAREREWTVRADEIEGKAVVVSENNLIEHTVEMWQRHASVAGEVAMKAFQYIQENGFDNSMSALQALKWAQEEERKTRGAEALVSTIKNAANEDLLETVRNLAARQLNIDANDDNPTIDVAEVPDAEEKSGDA